MKFLTYHTVGIPKHGQRNSQGMWNEESGETKHDSRSKDQTKIFAGPIGLSLSLEQWTYRLRQNTNNTCDNELNEWFFLLISNKFSCNAERIDCNIFLGNLLCLEANDWIIIQIRKVDGILLIFEAWRIWNDKPSNVWMPQTFPGVVRIALSVNVFMANSVISAPFEYWVL